jgi:hypothetical protein
VVLEQLECDAVADREFTERRALAHVAPVEKDLATARQPDEGVASADQ